MTSHANMICLIFMKIWYTVTHVWICPTVQVVFFPTTAESSAQDFTIVCDNCQVRNITLQGTERIWTNLCTFLLTYTIQL